LQERKARAVKSIHRPEYKALLGALVEARKAQGITQAQLAKKLKKPQSYVSKFENGERRIDVIEFMEICAAIGVDYGVVLEGFFN
jgi:transcriptional regulator with XRE-family HTH domain